MGLKISTLILVLIMSEIITCAIADSATDKEDCTEQLTGMATCLPYVQGEAKSPTPDCCSGLKQVLKDNKTCLCVIIVARNDPDLSLNINVTLALGLPSVCNAPANVSQCPALLHLAPNSTEAQVFYQFGSSSNHTASIPAPSAEGNYTSSNSDRQSGTVKGEGWSSRKKWVGLEFVASVGVFLWFYNSPLFI